MQQYYDDAHLHSIAASILGELAGRTSHAPGLESLYIAPNLLLSEVFVAPSTKGLKEK